MKNFVFLIASFISFSALAQDPMIHPPTNDPRTRWTKEKIEAIITPYLNAKKIELGIAPEGATLKLLSSEVWSDYVNHKHFVNIQTEGVPAGYVFDYNFKMEDFWELPAGKRQRGLPLAEIIETGEFFYWWERYNYYNMDTKAATDHIKMAIDHELYHYLQWKRIVGNAMVMGGCVQNTNDNASPVKGIKIPNTLSQLEQSCNSDVVEMFNKLWKDPAHYQCREVEVYSTQIENNQFQQLDQGYFIKLLKGMKEYLKGDVSNPYSLGCENSMWANEFMPYVIKANAQLVKYKTLMQDGPSAQKK